MKITSLVMALAVMVLGANAQVKQVPAKITVPAVCSDKNQVFNILHFEPGSKPNTYSIIYYQTLNASVLTASEFLRDTGGIAFEDQKKLKAINYSDQALLVVKQTVDANGTGVVENVNVLAKRKFESTGPYTLYFRKGFKHPILNSAIPVQYTVYNLDNVPGLSPTEYEALTILIKREYAPEYYTEPERRFEPTLADDFRKLKSDLQYLGATGLNFRGDIPANEKVISRFTMSDKRNLVVTTEKAMSEIKFYLTEDFTKMEQIGSSTYEGELQLAAISPVYNENLTIVGAYGVGSMKVKGPDKKDVLTLISFALDENNDMHTWKHNVGASKLGSVSPEICWFEEGKLNVLSTNAEKMFKQFHQIHQFEKDKEPMMTFPLSEEEKALDKFAYTKTFQPQGPVGQTSPLPTARIPYMVKKIGNTMYFVIQSYSKDYTTNTESYLGLDVYKFDNAGKFYGITALNGYQAANPVNTANLLESSDQLDMLISYPTKYQLELTEEKVNVIQIESNTLQLTPLQNGNFQSTIGGQTILLGKNPMGTTYTLMTY